MIIIFDGDESPDRARQVRQWWLRNGLLGITPDGPIRIDTEARTIAYRQAVDEPQPGEPDYPELRRDVLNRPLTVELTAPLLVDPPSWARSSSPESRVA